jgi:Aspartyl protease
VSTAKKAAPRLGMMLLAWLILFGGPVRSHAQPAASGTVPFVLDGNRVYVHVQFITPEGKARKALVFVDLGSPSVILSKQLYGELGLDSKRALEIRIGEMHVSVGSANVSSDDWLPFPIGEDRMVEGLLPAGVLQNYQLRFDYAARTMTLALPATLQLQGTAVPFRLNPKTGLVAIEVQIDGQTYPITIDNGSGYTCIRKTTAQQWFSRHPEWQRGIGAVGPSNMRMADDGIETAGALVRIPEMKLGSLRVEHVGALAIAPDNQGHDFMDWYSMKNPVAVIGWLGGNVLRHYRITIDYPKKMSYWDAQSALDNHDLDYVGLTLRFTHGEYFVEGITTQEGRPTVLGAQVGDKLVQIGKLQTQGASREAIFAALHGHAGETRSLVLERQGSRIQLQTTVAAF